MVVPKKNESSSCLKKVLHSTTFSCSHNTQGKGKDTSSSSALSSSSGKKLNTTFSSSSSSSVGKAFSSASCIQKPKQLLYLLSPRNEPASEGDPPQSSASKGSTSPSRSSASKGSTSPPWSSASKGSISPQSSALKGSFHLSSVLSLKGFHLTSVLSLKGFHLSSSVLSLKAFHLSSSASNEDPGLPCSSSLVCLSDSPIMSDKDIWIRQLELYYNDKVVLELPNGWLNDNINRAAQCLFSQKSEGRISGWQNTQCSKAGFSVLAPNVRSYTSILATG